MIALGIWGLTLVRLHQQASQPYLEIAADLSLWRARALGATAPGGSSQQLLRFAAINDGL